MCGVIGYYNKGTLDLELVSRLFSQSKIRGKHAYGIYDGKSVQKSLKLSEIMERVKVGSKFMIGHCRYSTSGDFRVLDNNQPVVSNSVVSVFNGVISMKTKECMESEFGFKLSNDNDGEVFNHNVAQGTESNFIESYPCSFAGLYAYQGELFAIRNLNRPLWYGILNQSIYVASTKDIFKRAKFHGEIEQFKPCTKYRLSELSHT